MIQVKYIYGGENEINIFLENIISAGGSLIDIKVIDKQSSYVIYNVPPTGNFLTRLFK